MASKYRKRAVDTLNGYFLPENQQCHEEHEEDIDVSDDEEWQDMEDLDNGFSGSKGKALKTQKCN